MNRGCCYHMCLWSLLVLVLFLEYKPSQGRSTVLFFEYRPRMIGSFRRVFLRPRGLKQTPHSRNAPLGSETAPSLKAGLSWYFLQWFLLCDRHSQQMLGNDFFLKLFSSFPLLKSRTKVKPPRGFLQWSSPVNSNSTQPSSQCGIAPLSSLLHLF